MELQVFNMRWGEFVTALKDGTVTKPFLVRESDPGDPAEWYLYAESPRTLVQVLTLRGQRRSWRRLDGAFRDMERDIGEMPPITIYPSIEAVNLLPLSSPESSQ